MNEVSSINIIHMENPTNQKIEFLKEFKVLLNKYYSLFCCGSKASFDFKLGEHVEIYDTLEKGERIGLRYTQSVSHTI